MQLCLFYNFSLGDVVASVIVVGIAVVVDVVDAYLRTLHQHGGSLGDAVDHALQPLQVLDQVMQRRPAPVSAQ